MDVETWNAVLKTAAMFLTVATALAAGAGWYTESIVSERQAARLATIGKEIADAKTKQTEAETRLAMIELDTEQQRQRAAEAERKLESERAARVKLDERTSNRWLEPKT